MLPIMECHSAGAEYLLLPIISRRNSPKLPWILIQVNGLVRPVCLPKLFVQLKPVPNMPEGMLKGMLMTSPWDSTRMATEARFQTLGYLSAPITLLLT